MSSRIPLFTSSIHFGTRQHAKPSADADDSNSLAGTDRLPEHLSIAGIPSDPVGENQQDGERNFKRFKEKAATTLQQIYQDEEQSERVIRAKISQSPDFKRDFEKKRDEHAHTVSQQNNQHIIWKLRPRDNRQALESEHFITLLKPFETAACDPTHKDHQSAKFLLYVLNKAAYGSFTQKLQALSNSQVILDKLAQQAQQKDPIYLMASSNPSSYSGSNVSIQETSCFSLPSSSKKALEEDIEKAAQQGNMGAKAYLYCKSGFGPLPIPAENIIQRLQRQMNWKEPITWNGEMTLVTKDNLQSISEAARAFTNEFNGKVTEPQKQARVKENLTPVLKQQVVQDAKNLIKQMEHYKQSDEMKALERDYIAASQKAEKDIEAALSNSIAEAKQTFDADNTSYGPRNEIIRSLFRESKIYQNFRQNRQDLIPEQLKSFQKAWPEDFNPYRIVLVHPERRFSSTMRGDGITSAQISTNTLGDLVLEFPKDNSRGHFKNIEYNGKHEYKNQGLAEHFRITEVMPKNSASNESPEESYTLITGTKLPNGQPCVRLVCDGGSEQILEYGKPVIWSSVVRKPIIAFRNFSKETELTISVDFSGEYQVVYPQASHADGSHLRWTGTATPDNTFLLNQKAYPYLFWDGNLSPEIELGIKQGYCIPASETITFLEKHATRAGLDHALVTDFVTFWAPYLQSNPYNLIRFLSPKECETIAKMEIIAPEETAFDVIRLYMIFQPVNAPVALPIPELDFEPLKVDQSKVIEWGGFCIA